ASMLCARGTLAAQVPSDTEMATADAATSAVDAAAVTGFVCFGYPFHPRGKPETLRIAHLAELQVPGLILQGTRDPLGNRDDVAGYEMSPGITVRWLEDGDHDFAPRKRSGITLDAHLTRAAREVSAFAHRVSNQR
ncbi:MAG: alpha/beta family hydrolase, partial [Pseudomonadota bacterium]